MLLLVIVALVAAAVCVFSSGLRVPGGVIPNNLGWMSDQWLAEHRASQAS